MSHDLKTFSYTPLPAPTDPDDIPRYLESEFRRISEALQDLTYITLGALHAAPDRTEEGMIVRADGTNWNPGSGAGFYGRVGGAWTFLG